MRGFTKFALVTLALIERIDADCQTARLYIGPKGSRKIAAGENVVYGGALYQAISEQSEGSAAPNSNSLFKKIQDCPTEFKNGIIVDCSSIPSATTSATPAGASKFTTTLEGITYSFKFVCTTGGPAAPGELENCRVEGACHESTTAASTAGQDCSTAVDLPTVGTNVKAGLYTLKVADNQKHLLRVAYELWEPKLGTPGVTDLGVCSAASLETQKVGAPGTMDCSTIPVATGTAAGTFLVEGPDGKQHRLTCRSPVYLPKLGNSDCNDEGICSDASLKKRPTAPVPGVAGGPVVAAPVDLSKLPVESCEKAEMYKPEWWTQVGTRAALDGYLYECIVAMKGGPKDKPEAWRAVHKCDKDHPNGKTINCSNFTLHDETRLRCKNEKNKKTIGVKFNNIGYKVIQCLESPKPLSDVNYYELAGPCEGDTGIKEPLEDCSGVLNFKPHSHFRRHLGFTINSTRGPLDMENFRVKKDGLIYTLKYDGSDLTDTSDSKHWAFDGACSHETATTTPSVDCSFATLMRPGRIENGPVYPAHRYMYAPDHILYEIIEYSTMNRKGEVNSATAMPIGKCIEGTELGFEKSPIIVDCTNLTKWNPKTAYFHNGTDPLDAVILENEGNVYHMKSGYSAYTAPGLNDQEFTLNGTCKTGTEGKIELGPNDLSIDQEILLRVCCPQADCAAYFGRVDCVKVAKEEDYKKIYGVDFCPLVRPQEHKTFVDDHWKGSWFEKRNFSRDCETMTDSQVMDFYSGVVHPSPGNWPAKFVAPYFDVGLAQFPPLEHMVAPEKGLKVQHFFAAFVQTMTGDRCEGAWASAFAVEVGPRGWGEKKGGVPTYYYEVLNRIRDNGGDWAVSFGGYNGVELADSEQCEGNTTAETVENIKNAYKRVIEATKVSHINFDIEGGSIQTLTHKDTHWEYRSDALLALMKEMPHLKISHTFPVLPTGLADDGINYVDMLMRKGVRNDYILAMTMDYGDAVCPTNPNGGGKTMFDCEKTAMQGLAQQVFNISNKYGRNPGWKSAEDVYPILGSIPMIGQNDVVDEIYTFADAENAVKFYQEAQIGVSSYWAATRDRSKFDQKSLPPVDSLKRMQDAIKNAQAKDTKPKSGKVKKGYSDSTSDGVTPKGSSFLFTNIFVEHVRNPTHAKKALPPLF